jgi:hypothetical protein
MDFAKLWPSSYADGGRVAWGTAKADIHGCLKVSFPDIRLVYVILNACYGPVTTPLSPVDGSLSGRQKGGLHCNTMQFSVPLSLYTHLLQCQTHCRFRIFSSTFYKDHISLSSLPLIALNVGPRCPNGILGTYTIWNALFLELLTFQSLLL